MYLSLLFAHAADLFLGKVDKASLSQETLMELLVEGFTSTAALIKAEFSTLSFKNIKEWNGVTLTDAGHLDIINWSSRSLHGTVNLNWIPPTLFEFDVSLNQLDGSIDLTDLPSEILNVWLSHNSFSGEICLTRLPDKILILDVSFDCLSGSVDLTRLPQGINQLYIERNPFAGETDFSKLPDSLECFNAFGTHLSGRLVTEKPFDVRGSNVVFTKI